MMAYAYKRTEKYSVNVRMATMENIVKTLTNAGSQFALTMESAVLFKMNQYVIVPLISKENIVRQKSNAIHFHA